MNPCIAVSVEADFDAGTWTFEPVENFVVGAGRYTIMREAEYEAMKKQRDELLACLKALMDEETACELDRDLARFAIAKAESKEAA